MMQNLKNLLPPPPFFLKNLLFTKEQVP